MFNGLPSFLSGWELPSLASYTGLSTGLQKRVISFLLRRALGHLVKPGQLDWNQIEAGVGDGRLEIRDIELETDVSSLILPNIEDVAEHTARPLPLSGHQCSPGWRSHPCYLLYARSDTSADPMGKLLVRRRHHCHR